MEDQILTFRELIAPLTPEAFFGETYRRRALHIPGPPDKFAEVFSWDRLNELIGNSTLWTERSFELAINGHLLAPEDYCYPGADREGKRVMKPDVVKVRRHLRKGATLALDFIELLSPGLRSVTQTLEAVTGAQVCASAFCSWQETQGYASHFDTQNVFACHLAGTKTWRIYEGRTLNAADFPGGNRDSFPQEHHEQAKGKVIQEITLKPGDLLYIPHGLYHDALSSSEACLHVSFGVMHLVVQDFLQALMKDLPKDPLFREHLPHFDDVSAHEPYLRRVGQRFHDIVSQPVIAQQLRGFLRQQAFQRVADFNLPDRQDGGRFRVLWRRAQLLRQNGAWRLAGAGGAATLEGREGEIAEWIMARDYFSAKSLSSAFGANTDGGLDGVLARLETIGLIEPM